jgi:hypothetical protein
LQGGDYLPVQNCSDLQRFVGLLTDGSEQCNAVHYISTYCGCTAALQECAFCSDGTPVPYPDKQLSWLDDYLFDVPHFFRSFPLTCSIFEAQLQNVPDNQFGISHGLLCMSAQFKSGICGCEYSWKPKLVVWAYRTSGMLSLVVSWVDLKRVARMKWTYSRDLCRVPFQSLSTFFQVERGDKGLIISLFLE